MTGTHVDVVVHDVDMIENSSKVGQVGHGVAIRTNECSGRDGGRDVKVLSRGVLTQLLEERKEILGIGGRLEVTANSSPGGIFPAKQ